MARECLILGCSQAGKTLLLRRLTSVPGKSVNLETAPTTGVEVESAVLRGVAVTLREVGSVMRMMWPSYYEKASCVLFVVDAAEPSLLAEAAAELAELAADLALAGKPIAVVANKRDLEDEALADAPLRSVLFLDALSAVRSPPVQLLHAAGLVDPAAVAASAPGGRGDLDALAAWVAVACSAPPPGTPAG